MAMRKGRAIVMSPWVIDRTTSKRRKPVSDEVNDSDEESKKSKTQEMGNSNPSGRGSRGRGRGRDRGGRAARAAERENLNLLKTVSRCMCQCHHPKRFRRRTALQHQTKTPSNNFKVQKKALTLISTLNLST
ncbi:hypothetical protein Bca52824_018674 [Brassica carinata]|uniref:Uncharacterized protein n=1 Tax=Brassica carinata TaxID=52824 RepID=A0A8X8AZP0_BRACI|nr:hypothetical protein Bca52824_018674 [Brassica carinata]